MYLLGWKGIHPMWLKKCLTYWLLILGLCSCQNQKQNILHRSPFNKSSLGVIGGESAAPSEFPFIVNIWLNTPEEGYDDHLCGASLIHPKWVLTAAHCVLDDASESTFRLIKPNKLKLYIGSDAITGEGGRLLKVKSIKVHPDFSWPHHDVAMIELSTPVTDIEPVILNTQDPEGWLNEQLTATVVGWGLIDQEGLLNPDFLQKTTLPIISRNACNKDSFVQKINWTISSDMLCARTMNNQNSSCPGDSGGPLVIDFNGEYIQIGIVSWGSACNGKPPRIVSDVEGHANVSDAHPWINSLIYSN